MPLNEEMAILLLCSTLLLCEILDHGVYKLKQNVPFRAKTCVQLNRCAPYSQLTN